MQPEELTENGIELLLNGNIVILQVLSWNLETIVRNGVPYEVYKATLSDGFSLFNDICFHEIIESDNNIVNGVIQISLHPRTIKNIKNGKMEGKEYFIDSTNFSIIYNKIKTIIGCPISHLEFIKNGQINLKGNRKIFIKYENNEETDEESEIFKELQKNQHKIKNKQKLNNSPNNRNSNQSINQSNSSANKNINTKEENRNNSNQPKSKDKSKEVSNSKSKPKNVYELKRTSIKPEVSHHLGDHEKIKDLFLNIENFKLIVRLLFIWPIKSYINKKGIQSELLNIEFGDDTGSIMCTVFGDNASRFKNLAVDKIYSIEGATITEATYKGQTESKLNFNENTKVTLINGDQYSIPPVENFCLNLNELKEEEKGKIVSVKCFLKESETVEFVSRNGNKIKKKTLKMFDIENQIESELTLMNEKAEENYHDGMYALKGVEIDEYQGIKQFKGSIIFIARELNHPQNIKFKEINQINFVTIGSNKKEPNQQKINSFTLLNEKSEDLVLKGNLWSELICYVKGIRFGNNYKSTYLSCPHCKKKIFEEQTTECKNCKKEFERPIHRYLLSIRLSDDHESIWANAYEEGEKIMALPSEEIFTADNFVETNEEALRERIEKLKYKKIKVKIVSSKEEFNNEIRIRHKIIQVLPIIYHEECQNLLKNIKAVTMTL